MAIPRGRQPLVTAKRMPAFCNALTALSVRLVKIFCSVTSVPSTSARTGETFPLTAMMISTPAHPNGLQARPIKQDPVGVRLVQPKLSNVSRIRTQFISFHAQDDICQHRIRTA